MAKLEMHRGDDRTIRVVVKDKAQQPYVWLGSEIWFTAKKSAAASDANAIIKKTTADFDLSIPGVATAPIGKAETESLPGRTETYFYDVQIKRADGKIETVDDGTITIRVDVTHAT